MSQRKANATRLPTDWQLTGKDLSFAQNDMGWPPQKIVQEAAHFRDSALAHGRRYVDWHAAWRNWCRSPFQKPVSGNGHVHPPHPTAAASMSDLRLARKERVTHALDQLAFFAGAGRSDDGEPPGA